MTTEQTRPEKPWCTADAHAVKKTASRLLEISNMLAAHQTTKHMTPDDVTVWVCLTAAPGVARQALLQMQNKQNTAVRSEILEIRAMILGLCEVASKQRLSRGNRNIIDRVLDKIDRLP